MARNLLALLVIASLSLLTTASAGPVKGPFNVPERVRVPAAKNETPGETEVKVRYRGNERAAVIVKGDHQPVTDLEVLVFEILPNGETGPLVARGHGSKDLVAAHWAPLRTRDFRIVFRNPAPMSASNPYNECYVTFK